MRTYGIIGRPLGHSFSKAYFERKFASEELTDCRFLNFPLDDIAGLDTMLSDNPDLCGFSVTIPYKLDIIPHLDSLSNGAREIGAVNCVRVTHEDGKPRLEGHNTDALGFRVSLERLLAGAHPAALILGTGGASRAVRHVLELLDIDYRMVSRSPRGNDTLTYEELTPEIIEAHKLIVNTTPLGTFPEVAGKPALPYDAIGPEHYLYDLVYNPATTAFLAEGTKRGAATTNGEEMLHAQAEAAWKIWNS
ncbi:MAG: shikimate dehydrogenase [Alistipes sp.]|jgi:shikimate dehydrogenase|nr:shikimate dehydrogenase [Alistipes sp.]